MAAGNWHLIFTPVQIDPHLVQKCKIGEQARTRTSTISASEIIVLVVVLVLVLEISSMQNRRTRTVWKIIAVVKNMFRLN